MVVSGLRAAGDGAKLVVSAVIATAGLALLETAAPPLLADVGHAKLGREVAPVEARQLVLALVVLAETALLVLDLLGAAWLGAHVLGTGRGSGRVQVTRIPAELVEGAAMIVACLVVGAAGHHLDQECAPRDLADLVLVAVLVLRRAVAGVLAAHLVGTERLPARVVQAAGANLLVRHVEPDLGAPGLLARVVAAKAEEHSRARDRLARFLAVWDLAGVCIMSWLADHKHRAACENSVREEALTVSIAPLEVFVFVSPALVAAGDFALAVYTDRVRQRCWSWAGRARRGAPTLGTKRLCTSLLGCLTEDTIAVFEVAGMGRAVDRRLHRAGHALPGAEDVPHRGRPATLLGAFLRLGPEPPQPVEPRHVSTAGPSKHGHGSRQVVSPPCECQICWLKAEWRRQEDRRRLGSVKSR